MSGAIYDPAISLCSVDPRAPQLCPRGFTTLPNLNFHLTLSQSGMCETCKASAVNAQSHVLFNQMTAWQPQPRGLSPEDRAAGERPGVGFENLLAGPTYLPAQGQTRIPRDLQNETSMTMEAANAAYRDSPGSSETVDTDDASGRMPAAGIQENPTAAGGGFELPALSNDSLLPSGFTPGPLDAGAAPNHWTDLFDPLFGDHATPSFLK